MCNQIQATISGAIEAADKLDALKVRYTDDLVKGLRGKADECKFSVEHVHTAMRAEKGMGALLTTYKTHFAVVLHELAVDINDARKRIHEADKSFKLKKWSTAWDVMIKKKLDDMHCEASDGEPQEADEADTPTANEGDD